MSEYVLSCGSTADLTKETFNERNIKYICYQYELDGKEYLDDFWESIPCHEFYEMMKKGSTTKTSQVNSERFIKYFEPFLKEGKDILHLTLSSGLTGIGNSANMAVNVLKEKYPDRKIYIVDSLAVSAGYGMLMECLADLRDQGKSIEEAKEFALNNRKRVNHLFFSSDLSFYIRGGRLSKTAGAVGQALSICPLLNVDGNGRLNPCSKVRTKKKAMTQIINWMSELAEDGLDYDGKLYICQTDCLEDAKEVEKIALETFPKLKGKTKIFQVGTIIGAHTGPGTIAIMFWGKERE